MAQVERVTRGQAVELISNTYGGFLANRAQPGWLARFEADMAVLLARMEAVGLIEPDGSHYIRLSILGHACGQSPLELESAMQLIEMLRLMQPDDLTPMTLMALVQALPEQDADYTPLGKGRSESKPSGRILRALRVLAASIASPGGGCFSSKSADKIKQPGIKKSNQRCISFPQSLSQL